MITQIELDEARYNSRDCLGMCRVYSHLVAALERSNVVQVYEADEQMGDLALQMTRVGMPVNSELRGEIGARLRKLRDDAVIILRQYTEGDFLPHFIEWAANFMAATVRKGEPEAGAARVGPARAQATLDDAKAALVEWRAYLKTLAPDDVEVIADIQAQMSELKLAIIEAKRNLTVAQTCNYTDADDGLPHSLESAFAARVAIRTPEFVARLEKSGVNFGAKIQQAAILRAAGVPLLRVTEKSKMPKIDKEVLGALSRHPAAKALLRYILVDKTITMYIEGEQREGKGAGKTRPVMVTDDGYLRPLWTIHKITGRWGSSPNVQNFSKRAGDGSENLRAMVEPPEGYTFVGADQKQLEARLIGAMSQCPYMIDTFRRGEDIHSAFSAIGFPVQWPKLAAAYKEHKAAVGKCNCNDCQMRDKIRDLVKRLEYGGFYGGAAQTLWESVVSEFPDVPMSQIVEFLRQFNLKLPEVLAWRENVLREAIHDGCIRSPILGRMQVFPLARVDPTVAYNYKAQSGGADLWALGAIEFCKIWDQSAFDARIVHNGHDSVLVLCREEYAPAVEADIYTCWNREWQGVPFEMEAKIGKSWSET